MLNHHQHHQKKRLRHPSWIHPTSKCKKCKTKGDVREEERERGQVSRNAASVNAAALHWNHATNSGQDKIRCKYWKSLHSATFAAGVADAGSSGGYFQTQTLLHLTTTLSVHL